MQNAVASSMDPSSSGKTKLSPLAIAAGRGHIADIIHLLKEGQDVNAEDQDGWTPLAYAAAMEHFDAAKILIAYGAKLHCVDALGHQAILKMLKTIWPNKSHLPHKTTHLVGVDRHFEHSQYPH
ncbi:MAG: ankyrin repeat domain-containing protein [Gammaproteobacteria bacterium]